ncbi:T9SS type A sorting domain-containing protein [bacterium SCSIO 12741]|nr:T9SS type A sorting domain-containing protein [bacterium SCSIO 12741]
MKKLTALLLVLFSIALAHLSAQTLTFFDYQDHLSVTGADNKSITEMVYKDNHLYTVGYFNKLAFINQDTTVHAMQSGTLIAGFVTKSDSAGNLIWAKSFGNPGIATPDDIAVDDQGNLYITGYFGLQIPVDFDPGPGTFLMTSERAHAQFILKLDSRGNFVWARQLPQNSRIPGYLSITLDGAGDVYVAGGFQDTIDLDPGPGVDLNPGNGSQNSFLMKLNPNGQRIWVESDWGGGNLFIRDVQIDPQGGLYLTGACFSSPDLDPGPCERRGTKTFYIAKWDTSRQFHWARDMERVVYSILPDSMGNLYYNGSYQNHNDFDPGPGVDLKPHLPASTMGLYLAKMSAEGIYQWSRAMKFQPNWSHYPMMMGKSGDLLTAGYFDLQAQFDEYDTAVTRTQGGRDAFIVTHSANGEYLGKTTFASSQNESIWHLAGDPNTNNLFVNFSVTRSLDLDPDPQQTVTHSNGIGYFDLVVARYKFCTVLIPTDTVFICPGDSVWVAGAYRKTIGNYSEPTNVPNCNCHTLTTVAAAQSQVKEEIIALCPGKVYTFRNGDTTHLPTKHECTLSFPGACDTTFITHVVSSPPCFKPIYKNASTCVGQLYYFPDGDTSSIATIDTSYVSSPYACDSMIITQLQVVNQNKFSVQASVCQGNFYTFPDGDTSSIATVDTSVMVSQAGCQSTIITHLTISPGFHITENASVCKGQVYMFPDGDTSSMAGTHISHLSSHTGCDSLVETQLTLNPHYERLDSAVICPGDQYLFPGGNIGTMATTDTALLSTQMGCDSTIITVLEVKTLDTVVTEINGVLVARDSLASSYQWIECHTGKHLVGEQQRTFTPTQNGYYGVIISRDNCSDTACFAMETVGIQNGSGVQNQFRVYPNPTERHTLLSHKDESIRYSLTLYNSKGQVLLREDSIKDSQFPIDLAPYPKGVYHLQVTEQSGRSTHFRLVKR